MKFSQIPGHDELKESLRSLVDTGRLPHALLIGGVPGIGKMQIARTLAQYVHCTDRRNGEPCGECASCVQHESLNHADMNYVFPVIKTDKPEREISADYMEEWRTMLTEHPYMEPEAWQEILNESTGGKKANAIPRILVPESRAVLARAALTPFNSQYKIFLLWLPERLNAEAANRLLKLIEEPDPDTLFIFVSNNEQEILGTIYSRLQRFKADRLGDEEMISYLMSHYGLKDYDAARVAKLAEGRLARADELVKAAGEEEEFRLSFEAMMRAVYGKKTGVLLEMASDFADFGREKLKRFIDYCSHAVRENFIHRMLMPELEMMTPAEEAFASRFSPFIHHGNVEQILKELTRARDDIDRNANSKIVLYSMFLFLIPLLHAKVPA